MDVTALAEQAARRLPAEIVDYYAGGAGTESTVTANPAAWQLPLWPRVLRDVTDVDVTTTLLGGALAAPLLVAPMAVQVNAHPDGELATAAGAAAAGCGMVVSTMASHRLQDVVAVEPVGPRWFQLYLRRDREWGLGLARAAQESGYDAVVLTVDVPVLGPRHREARGFALADGPLPPNLRGEDDPQERDAAWAVARDRYASHPGLTFRDLASLADELDVPVAVKGVLRADDARRCVDAGAAAVLVSNHGGRQLDGAVTTARALPSVAAAVGGDVPVVVDGGITSGRDVLTALALGADAVLVGRPVLWALAVGGADGVADFLRGLTDELVTAMRLAGLPSLADVDAGLLDGGQAADGR